MKVVFTLPLPPYKVGEVSNVSDGYARNFLIPKGFARPADDKTVIQLNLKNSAKQEHEFKTKTKLLESLEHLQGTELVIEAKVAPSGRLYAALSPKQIAAAISENLDINLPKAWIAQLPSIKEQGSHEITLQENGKSVKFTLKV